MRHVLGPPPLRVLDAAMGIGCETVFLSRQGYDVVGNEISRPLRVCARARAKSQRTRIHVSAVDWRSLTKTFGRGEFGGVLLMGNCLCLLRELRARRIAAENLRAICKNGGHLVVDERNFEYIIGNREAILKGRFRYSGGVVYCGKRIRGVPVSIDNDCVRFEYRNVETEEAIGHLDMHPFRNGEIVSLFQAAGFREATVYSDFEIGYQPDADFYTYVFR